MKKHSMNPLYIDQLRKSYPRTNSPRKTCATCKSRNYFPYQKSVGCRKD